MNARDQLVEALIGSFHPATALEIGTRLAPLVDRIATEAAANALMAAAEQWAADPDAVGDSFIDARNWLRDRATAIREADQ